MIEKIEHIGIAVKNYNGKFVHINGNQTMVVLTDYLLSKLSKEKAKSFIASTVVSTPMMSKIAKKNSIKIIIQKKHIVMGRTEDDITKDVLDIMNKTVKNIKVD